MRFHASVSPQASPVAGRRDSTSLRLPSHTPAGTTSLRQRDRHTPEDRSIRSRTYALYCRWGTHNNGPERRSTSDSRGVPNGASGASSSRRYGALRVVAGPSRRRVRALRWRVRKVILHWCDSGESAAPCSAGSVLGAGAGRHVDRGKRLLRVGGWSPVVSRMPANPQGYGDLRLCVTSGC